MQLVDQLSQDPPVETEQLLLARCQAGDLHAFGQVVRKYMRQAYFSALGLLGNHADALDLSQEAFVRAHRAISRFDPGKPFFTWYYQILRNLCLNFLRDSAKHRHLSLVDENTSGEPFELPLRSPSSSSEPNLQSNSGASSLP